MTKRKLLQSAAVALLLAGGALLLGGCSDSSKPGFSSIDVTGADYAKDFQLTDQDGQARTLKDYRGKIVVMFFGYTQCPDVCPTSLTELVAVKKLLGADGDKLQALFVSVDPARDTPEVLKTYMGNFDPSFVALYADTPEKLAALAKDYKVYYKKVEGKTPTSYTMDHSAGMYIYDPEGQLRLYSRYGSGAGAVAFDTQPGSTYDLLFD
jgi:protein SCO1/2